MQQKSMINDLTEGSVFKKLILFAIPFMIANVIQTLYGVVDMVVVGKTEGLGSIGLSAVSIGSLLTQLFTNFCMGFTGGGQIVLAQLVGSRQREKLNKTIGTMFTMSFVFGLFFAVAGVVFARQLLSLVNTPPDAFEQTRRYLTICSLGMVFIFGYNAVCAVLRGMGDSRRPLMFVSVSAVINIVLDLLFIRVFKLQSEGAAIATVISQASSLLFAFGYLYRRREIFGFDFRLSSFKVDGEMLQPILKLGLPQGIKQSSVILSFMYVNSQVNAYGTIASAVSGVGLKINSILGVVTNALSVASSNMIGQNMAQGKTDRIITVVKTTLAINLVYTTLFSMFAMKYPEVIFGIFNKEAAVLEMSHRYMPYGVVAFYAFATMGPFTALVNGVGNSPLAFFIGIMDGIVARIGISMVCGKSMGLPGYWLGNGAAGYVSAILACIYFLSGKWKDRKPVVRN